MDDLRRRGLYHQCTNDDALSELLASGPQSVYIGFDPTADSLHVGSLLQLMMLRRFQHYGHRPIALVGGATGMIGDPSGKSKERNLLDAEQLAANVGGLADQMKRYLSFEGDSAATLVNNHDWMAGFSYVEFLRDIGKNFPVNVMMAKDSVKSRLEGESGLSYTEFSYMLLQAYDFVRLYRDYGCRIQAGGSDQWGNITAGIDLGRRMESASLFGLTVPLLTTAEGTKMGKTETGTVWLDAGRTSPYEFYQYWRNTADADVMKCLAFLTEIEWEEYESLSEVTRSDPSRRVAQERLAGWLTEFVHGPEGLKSATAASKQLFSGDLTGKSDEDLESMLGDVPTGQLPRTELDGDGLWVVAAMVATGMWKSNGEARREIKGGGVSIGGQKVGEDSLRLSTEHLTSESIMVIRKGKKKYAVLKFES